MGKKSRLKMLGSDKEGRIQQSKERARKQREEERKIGARWLSAKAKEIQLAKEQRKQWIPPAPSSPNMDKIRLAEINRKLQKTKEAKK